MEYDNSVRCKGQNDIKGEHVIKDYWPQLYRFLFICKYSSEKNNLAGDFYSLVCLLQAALTLAIMYCGYEPIPKQNILQLLTFSPWGERLLLPPILP